MVPEIAIRDKHGFEWLDFADPSVEEWAVIAREYKPHPVWVNDCL